MLHECCNAIVVFRESLTCDSLHGDKVRRISSSFILHRSTSYYPRLPPEVSYLSGSFCFTLHFEMLLRLHTQVNRFVRY